MKNKDVFILNWRDFEIEVTFVSSYSPISEKLSGFAMSHIEIRTVKPKGAALPITGTGYRSIFMALPDIEARGGVKTLILNELNEAAETKEWQEKEIKERQYSLF